MKPLLWFSKAVTEILTVAVRALQFPPTSGSPLVCLSALLLCVPAKPHTAQSICSLNFPYLTAAR